MKTKHTPGPWSYDRAPQDYDGAGSPAYSTITAENGEIVIAEVNDLIPSGLANAHLLVAAPDLLDALLESTAELEALMKDKAFYQGGQNILDRARVTIAKANGEDAR